MKHRYQFIVLVVLLFGITAAAFYHKTVRLGLPLSPHAMQDAWSVEARIDFTARPDASVRVQFPLPENVPGFLRLNEDFVARDFGLSTETLNGDRLAIWSIRRTSGDQALYYRASFYRQGEEPLQALDAPAAPPDVPEYPEPLDSAIFAVLDDVRQRSADVETFTRNLLGRLNASDPGENIRIIRSQYFQDDTRWTAHVAQVLAGARIAARPLYGIPLEDGLRRARPTTLLSVYDGSEWLIFDARTGQRRTLPPDFLVWYSGGQPLLQLSGADLPRVSFSVARNVRPQTELVQSLPGVRDSAVMDFSLMGLPVETQNLYRILFTLPIGALLVVLMRNVVGISTFGTFMPVLIALAFRETELLLGLSLFTLLVGIGLLMRFYMERLQLLFVPRLAAILTVVVLLMALVSVVSNLLGYQQGLAISIFPMVILAMTIERMSVVWEEQGAQEALYQAGGSLFTAVLGYLVMTLPLVLHLVFVFPEILLAVLALMLLLGRYTGYRLTELWRFRHALRGERGSTS